ncbi:MAG: SH3 domain-containing protein [Oscillatoriales cyanobacterium RM2_1_1]|nr:SH3 domain-containing protein [Oscillatoriales cyanobacterium SM2_3_0]NJO45728.1 SH3 domain-containing protein [Oscillatoriales cyanobacterium RM2_1_1]
MSLYGIFKFIVGLILAFLIMAGASVAAALYFAARLTELPERPEFANDKPAVAKATPQPTPALSPSPSPTPQPKALPEGSYRAVVIQPIGLILRDQPSIEANRIGGIAYEETVIVLEDDADGTWQKVQVEEDANRIGWVRGGNTERLSQ